MEITLENIRSQPPEFLEQLVARADRIKYAADPKAWVEERAESFAWSDQIKIMESVRDHRRTAVPTCHDIGKSWVAGNIAVWWLDSHEPREAFIVSTAPTFDQVKNILWKEIGKAKEKSGAPGKLNRTEWYMLRDNGDDEIVGFGRKPADDNPTALHGGRGAETLIIIDEACGVAPKIWDAVDTLMTGINCRILAIGNPDYYDSEFRVICQPGSGWNVIKVSAFDSPNFTGETVPKYITDQLISRVWVEEKKAKWGEESGIYKSKVLGEFPEVDSEGLIPASWVSAAQNVDLCGASVGIQAHRDIEPHRDMQASDSVNFQGQSSDPQNPGFSLSKGGVLVPSGGVSTSQNRLDALRHGIADATRLRGLGFRDLLPNPHNEEEYLGVDVGGGVDSSVIVHRVGNVARVVRRDTNPDSVVLQNAVQALCEAIRRTPGRNLVVCSIDYHGIGKGTADNLITLGLPVVGVTVGSSPIATPEESEDDAKRAYFNLRAQAYWLLRERFSDGRIDISPTDDDLAAEAQGIRLKPQAGKLQIESKLDMRRRGVSSPDSLDALMLAFCPQPIRKPRKNKATWGR